MTLNDLRIFFSQRGNWISLGLLPILFTLGLGVAFGGDGDSGPQTLRVDVIDEDSSAASAALLAELAAANDTLLLCQRAVDTVADSTTTETDSCALADAPLTVDGARDRVREGDSAALIVIPAGYGAALTNATRLEIDFYSATSPPTPDPVLQMLDVVLQRINSAALTAGVADAVLGRIEEVAGAAPLIAPWRADFVRDIYANATTLMAESPPTVNFERVGGTPSDEPNQSLQGFGQSVPGVGSMYVMFTVFGGMVLIQRERQRWTLQRLGVFPLRRSQILGGKILTYFTLGMLQYLVVFGVGLAVGLDFGAQPWLLLPVMIAFVLCCTALTFAIAPVLSSEGQASMTTQLLSLTFASLGGAWWPLEIVPEFMQNLGHLTPVAWAMDAFRDLIFYSGGLTAILPEVGMLLAAAAVLFGIGIWRFRYL